MFFKTINRYNSKSGKYENYYSLVESYRNALGLPSHRTLLSLGYDVDNSLPFAAISNKLNDLVAGRQWLLPLEERAEKFTRKVYRQLLEGGKIDVLRQIREAQGDWENVDLNTLNNEDVRELGAEWMSLQALQELGIDEFLRFRGWNEENIQLALSHIVTRAVYPASELKTASFIRENSSICELTGYPIKQISKDMTDCKTLGAMIDNLRSVTSTSQKRAIVVMDAGIATSENLALLTAKGYD